MFLRRIKSFNIRKNSKKNIVLVAVAIFMVYSFILNVLENVPAEADDQLALRREIVTRDIGVAPSDGQSRNVSSLPEVTKELVDKHGCKKWFENSFEENLNHISRYPRGVADIYMPKITGNLTKPKTMVSDFPVIATAADFGFYRVTQGLLKSIYEIVLPKYKNIKVVYYDMGLTQHQRLQLQKHCSICEVRDFPFDDLPAHVRKLKTYAWKPVIVKTLLMEFGWVWWMDSSVRFITSDLDHALNYSRDNSVLFFTYGVVFAVAQHTSVQTMQYLGEDICKFRHFGEVEATFVLFHFDHVTDIVIDQWTSCALNKNCIAPAGTEHKLSCNIKNKKDGRCHRFDQAVLSILLRRLYHEKNDYPLVTNPFHIHTIKRGQQISYFPE